MFFKVNTNFLNCFTFFDKINIFFIWILLFSPSMMLSQTSQQPEPLNVYYGKASYYDEYFNGRRTANGEIFSHTLLTAAHPTWPFNTKVRITNLANNNTVVVRINDRGPFIKGRQIDLSKQAAKVLGFLKSGVVEVKMEVLKWGIRSDSAIVPSPKLMANKTPKASKKTISSVPKTMTDSLIAGNKPVKPFNDTTTQLAVIPKTKAKAEKPIVEKKKKNEVKGTKASVDSTTVLTASIPKPEKQVTEKKKTNTIKPTLQPMEKKAMTLCSSADSLTGWCVQIGSYGSKANAERAVQAVTEITREWACIQEIYRNDVTLYRVVCGKNVENSRAFEIKQLLAKKYPDAFVTNYIALMNSAGVKK